MKRKLTLISLVTLIILFISACDNSQANVTNQTGEGAENVAEETVEIEDAVGNTVTVPLNPQKVAVFDNGQLDNLQSLGLEDRVILTASPNLPEHLSTFEDTEVAGTFFEIDLELTNASEPDLIIVAGRSSSAYDDLSSIAPTIDLTNDAQDYFNSIENNLDRLGTLFNVDEKADSLIQKLDSELSSLQNETQNLELNTMMTLFNEGSLSVYGSNSRFGIIHDAFGFTAADEEIEASNHGMEVSYEYILAEDPDILFILDRTSAIGGDVTSEELENNPIIQETQAYKEDTIYYLSPDAWYLSEGGAETFSIMMEEVSGALQE